jgi:hypothetical protein
MDFFLLRDEGLFPGACLIYINLAQMIYDTHYSQDEAIAQEEEEKYKEGLMILIQEDLHTVYGPPEEKKTDPAL